MRKSIKIMMMISMITMMTLMRTNAVRMKNAMETMILLVIKFKKRFLGSWGLQRWNHRRVSFNQLTKDKTINVMPPFVTKSMGLHQNTRDRS